MSSPNSYSNHNPSPKTNNPQIYSPQPFTPLPYNSQIYSPQSFSPSHQSKLSSNSHHSHPTTPNQYYTRPTTPNMQRSSNNNSPFNISSSELNNYKIHHSNSTSNLYIVNKQMQMPTAMGNINNNPNSLYPPPYKHSNKKAVHKVIQHTRKVVNEQNNEEVEVSTEVTQQMYKVNALGREEASLYSFTTYTNNDKKKMKHTKSNLEIHSYMSDSSSGSETPSPKIKEKVSHARKSKIESIPSHGSLESNNNNEIPSEQDLPQKYNVPLNDTVPKYTNHKRFSSESERVVMNKYNQNDASSSNNPMNGNDNVNPSYHKKHQSDYSKYTYNNNNENSEEQISIVISPSNNYSEETYREEISTSSPRSSYSVFSTTYQKTSNEPVKNNKKNKNTSEENVSINHLHNQNQNQNQNSDLNSIIISQFDSNNNSLNDLDKNSLNGIQNLDINASLSTHKLNSNRGRKTHKTTTTTTTTYEIIEDYDDDGDDGNDDNNNVDNEDEIEKFVHFNNFPFQFRRPTSFYNRALLPPCSEDVITDKNTLSQQINLRKKSWHTSFFESKGKASSSMFSIPRYQPENRSRPSKLGSNSSNDSLEDKTCFHILYQFDKEDFVVRLGKALYLYGSPTFRTECTLRSVSKLLGLQGEFASFPTLILLSFSNYTNNESLNSESHLLLTPTGYNLGKLEEVVQITYELKLALRSINHLRSNGDVNNKKDNQEKKDKKNKSEKNDKDEDSNSISIEIEKSSSINDISQISRKRSRKTIQEEDEENLDEVVDITQYSNPNNDNNSNTIYNNSNINTSKETIGNNVKEINIDNSNNEIDSISSKVGYNIQDIDTTSDDDFDKSEKVALTEAINKLDHVIAKPPSFGSLFWQILSYIVAGFTAAPILFGGTWLDGVVSGIAGLIVGLITYYEPSYFPAHGHLLELLASVGASATLRIIQGLLPKYCINFTADILSATLYLLPGLNFTIGFIELASRNMISGTVRLMHSLVTSFMMGAGITIGDHITKFVDVPIIPDATHTCETLAAPNLLWNFLMFPFLGVSLNMMFFANASQFPIMVFTTAISYVLNLVGTKLNIPSELTIIISALAVGIVSNIYAKLRKKLAIIPIIIGVLLLVPGSVGVKGSLAFLIDQNFETGIQFTVSMFTVSMWITIGVFLSNLIVFPFKNSEHMGLMTL